MSMNAGHTWALVLAAGEGSRLRSFTTTREGVSVPKQFCSLRGGPSLLHEALQRAAAVAAPERQCTVVAEAHRAWWQGSLDFMPASNIVVQPRNRGTAIGILLPLLHILERDPEARVVLLPADHHVGDEAILGRALQDAVGSLRGYGREIILLGIAPEEPDTELGYIVPSEPDANGLQRVARFVEKPALRAAHELIGAGALWNAFIVVAKARALLELFALRFPEVVADLQYAVAHDCVDPQQPVATRHVHDWLPDLDFSKHVAQGAEPLLRVLAVPSCGWSDLGTPQRLTQTLHRTTRLPMREYDAAWLRGHLNLAEQWRMAG